MHFSFLRLFRCPFCVIELMSEINSIFSVSLSSVFHRTQCAHAMHDVSRVMPSIWCHVMTRELSAFNRFYLASVHYLPASTHSMRWFSLYFVFVCFPFFLLMLFSILQMAFVFVWNAHRVECSVIRLTFSKNCALLVSFAHTHTHRHTFTQAIHHWKD